MYMYMFYRTPDFNSEQEDFLNGEDKKDYENVNSPFRKALDGLVKADDVDPKKASLLLFSTAMN